MSFGHYLGLLVDGQQSDRFDSHWGRAQGNQENEGYCHHLPAYIKGGPVQKVDHRGSREKGSDRKLEPVGLVTISLDVREQRGGLRNRTKVLSLGNYHKSCFIRRETEKGLFCQGGE